MRLLPSVEPITLLHVSRNEYGMYNQGCDGKRRRPEEDIVRPRVQWAAKVPTGVQWQHPNGRLLQFVSVDCNPIIRYNFQDLLDLTPPYIFSTNLHDSQKWPNLTPGLQKSVNPWKNHIPV
jgi:hypothetical protein